MPPRFRVELHRAATVSALPDAWTADAYRTLLGRFEVDGTEDTSTEDLRELCLLSLQDLEPAEAAEVAIAAVVGDALRPGQIRQIAQDAETEALWEEHPDMALHARLFDAGGLLHAASPGVFPKPQAVAVRARITALDPDGAPALVPPLDPAFVLRLLSAGMPHSALLHRMFDDQLAGASFPEAPGITWRLEAKASDGGAIDLHVVSAVAWLGPLRDAEAFEAASWPDLPESED